jgi:hypothetical protein
MPVQPERSMMEKADADSQQNTRGTGTTVGYARARALWVVLALLTVGLFVISLPAYAAQMQTLCPTPVCANGQLTAAQAEALVRLGFSLNAYAKAFVALNIVSSACWFLIALLVIWRGGNDRMTIFTAFTLLLFGVARFPDAPAALAAQVPEWWLPVMGLRYLGSACLSFFCYLFPDGRFVPWWTRWVAFAWILPQLPEFFAPSSSLDPMRYPPLLQAVGFLVFVLSVVVAQVYRYRRVSTPLQRQQTKWVVFGVAIALTGFLALTFLTPLIFPTTQPLSFSVPSLLAATYGVMLLVPVSLAIAILRHQLYDIDLLINRTLVYGSLTAILSGVYFLGVVGVQALIQATTGIQKESTLAIVASTLAVAALFQPLRRRLQRGIDRRFYRRRYDTVRTLERLAATFRQEVDLQTLTEQLLYVVRDTMQPAHLSLWLRPTGQPEHEGEQPW